MASFLVTGHGRSGTTWCARELNTSPTWTVTHEGHTEALISHQKQYPFLLDKTGDVDSRCRLVALDLLKSGRVSKLAVILRNPVDIVASAAGRSKPKGIMKRIVDNMPRDLWALDAVASDDRVHVVRFEDMVYGHGMNELAKFLGVDMPPMLNFEPANGPTSVAIPDELRFEIREKYRWFVEKWNL